MDYTDLKLKNTKQLRALLVEKQDLLRDLRFKASVRALKNVRAIRDARKIIARILTLLSEQKSATIEVLTNKVGK